MARTAIVAVVGFVIGAVAGNAIGVLVQSDNLPFFMALGALVGACGGSIMLLVLEQ